MTRKMKDSGIEWIGDIPENWEVTKLKRFVKIKSGDALDKKKFIDNGDIEVYGANAKLGNYDKSNIDKESIITGRVGTIGTLDIKVNVWITDNVLAIDVFNANLKFIYYFLHILNFGELSSSTAQPLITATKLLNINIAMPTSINQNKISNYLDKKTKQIEDIKNKISEEIENLENYKKSVITESVTKGLNKNVEMKDSGIEWIGEIPKHWKVVPLKRLAIYNQGTLDESTKKDYEFEYIDISSVKYGKGILPLETMTFEKAPSRARRIVHDGDIIISTVRTYLKAIATVPSSDKQMIASTGFCVVRTNGIIEQGFLKYSVQSEHFISEIASKSTGVSYPAINSTDLVNIKVLVPTKSERLEIIKYLDKKTKLIDDSIAIKQKQLEVLEEYKKSLIYEYVTGKKEVNDGEET